MSIIQLNLIELCKLIPVIVEFLVSSNYVSNCGRAEEVLLL
jgi:hypothetical protein